MIETVFLDAGGVLVNPNWDRVAAALGRHGVAISASALEAAEPHAKKQLDTGQAIQATNDRSRASSSASRKCHRSEADPAQLLQFEAV